MNYRFDSSFSLKIKDFIRLTNLQSAHGDYDHIGEAINLVNNFRVEKVIFNWISLWILKTFNKILNMKNRYHCTYQKEKEEYIINVLGLYKTKWI